MFTWEKSLRLIDAVNGDVIEGTTLVEELKRITSIIGEAKKYDLIFIDIARSPLAVITQLACHVSEIPFTYFFNSTSSDLNLFKPTYRFDGNYLIRINESVLDRPHIAYCIETSGTSGIRKQVGVPIDCIEANISEFVKLFNLNKNDRILMLTSFRFDPSLIETMMGFRVGAEIIICPDEFRQNSSLLLESIQKWKPTIVQLTPTVFSRFSDFRYLIGAESTVRILLIGGSAFPLSLVQKHRSPLNQTKIYDVYGVTEVSCWATYKEITKKCKSNELGTPINGTELVFSSDNELILAGSRQCYVNGILSKQHPTGDIVKYNKSDNSYRIIGRKDNQVKIRDIIMNLEEMSTTSFDGVEQSHFMQDKNGNLLMFVKTNRSMNQWDLGKIVEQKLGKEFAPSRILIVDDFPINENGKVDEKTLKSRLMSNRIDIRMIIEKSTGCQIDEVMDFGFKQIGIDSYSATKIAAHFDSQLFQKVLEDLLDKNMTIRRFTKKYSLHGYKTGSMVSSSNEIFVQIKPQPKLKWAVNMKKCIDGDPVLINHFNEKLVVVSSHAGLLRVINAENGKIVQSYFIKSSRFEATPVVIDGKIYIGNYDSYIYAFDIDKPSWTWRYKTGDVIKSSVRYNYKNQSICAISYDGFVYCINENGSLLWKTNVGAGSPAQPLLHYHKFIVTTIKGIIYQLNSNDGEIEWSVNVEGPVFSQATLWQNLIVITTANGFIVFLDHINANIIKKIKHNSGIFSSALIYNDLCYICTQDGCLIETDGKKTNVNRFKTKFGFCSFVKQPIIWMDSIYMMSTDGCLIMFDGTAGKARRMMNANCFSRPFLDNDCCIVASRDDWIRSFSYN